jgi:DNA-binding MarR family transcriptional regulator
MRGAAKKKSSGSKRPAHAKSPNLPPLTISRRELLIDGSDRHFRRLVHSLFGFLARHEAVRSGHAARIGLVGIEYTVLISIRHLSADNPDVSVTRVADHLYLSGAFVTTVTNKLVKLGLIHKRPDPRDRRRVRLEVSEKGNALLAQLAPAQRRVNDVQFGELTTDEFLQLLEIVEHLIETSDRAVRLQSYLAEHPDLETAPSVDLVSSPERLRQKPPTRRTNGSRRVAD